MANRSPLTQQRKAWLVMFAAYLAGVAVTVNQFKVPPVMEIMIANFKLDTATGGWLMSSFAIAGVILGLPAAIALDRLGPKRAGLVALGCTMAGSIMGALATNAALILISRAIEGIGLGLISVVSPAVISMWFSPRERGLPMGIWSTWVPVGTLVIYALTGLLLELSGWQGMWWFGAAIALVALVVYAVIVDTPQGDVGGASHHQTSGRDIGRILTNPSSLAVAAAFGAFCFGFVTYNTWAPTYLSQGLGLGPEQARLIASLSSLSIIPSMLLAGWVLDHAKNRELVLTIALLLTGILLMWSFRLTDANMAALYMLALGLVAGFVPTAIFTLAPDLAPASELAGVALAIVSIAQNLGTFIGPPVIGAFVAGGTWDAGIAPLVVAIAIGVLVSLFLMSRTGDAHRRERQGAAG